MKHIFCILTVLILSSCGQSNIYKDSRKETSAEPDAINEESKLNTTKPDLNQSSIKRVYNNQELSHEFKEAAVFQLTDTINADFNGDGNADQVIFKKENETSGIIITHGRTNQKIKIGFGKQFAHLKDFNWVEYWGLVSDSETYEVVIEDVEIIGEREVKLDNPSIVLRKEDVGGGLITFKDRKYIWIHQAD